ncbi:MAG TPA: 1-deoxy-D-xylulose-5-phosphate synthase N-terminal domain-containing protein [Patescibacteria group bacterium]|nr:1-deoxy-D-xylulose-5-phosphate synthase N-terminal domain-containing protein [Patescibacteria group bacterium]
MTELEILERVQRRVLWLSTWMVHEANARPSADGTKVGGHQASSASVVSLLTALYFKALRPGDVVATKAHAAPAFYAIQFLRGRLAGARLATLRAFGGLQAYPSRRKNPDVVDLSTGSMGLGAVMTTFGALATRYLVDHGAARAPERFVVMVGDAELDEGNVWEALGEVPLTRLGGDVLWIVDVNRQSLDRVVPETRTRQLGDLFRAHGWRVRELRWGRTLEAAFRRPGGERLRRRLETMPSRDYQRLLRLPAGAVRKTLVTTPDGALDADLDRALANVADDALPGLVADVGGHDLASILDALDEAECERGRPAVILADTIKGWRLPSAGDPLNHTMVTSPAQIAEVRDAFGIAPGEEWAGFDPASEEAAYVRGLPPLWTAPPRAAVPGVPATLDETYEGAMSSQEAFGRVLGALGRRPEGDAIVTVSADVAVTTHLAGWINRKGVYAAEARPDPFADAPQAMTWRESPAGRHIELGIAEHNLFLLLGALGLTAELSGTTLLPIGTLYDPFVPRGLDALYHALYAGGRFVVAATPSGVTLSPEGGAHQSVITPSIGVALPAIAYFEPAFAREVEWILLDGLAAIAAREGESLYLRLSTRPVSQALAPAPTPEYRDAVLRGGYRLSDARDRPGYAADRAVHVFAAGVMVTEALEAARALAGHGVFANVFVVTSPDRLYRGLRAPRPWLETLVAADEEDVPVVSVLDGHSHALGFIGGALGVPQQALGVEDFGQSGARADLYRHYGIDAAAIVAAARTLLAL